MAKFFDEIDKGDMENVADYEEMTRVPYPLFHAGKIRY